MSLSRGMIGAFLSATKSGTKQSTVSNLEVRVWKVLAVILTVLSVMPIWLVAFPPLQDYPYHLLRIHIIQNYTNPAFNYHDLFTVSLFPLPYILSDYLLLVFATLFPVEIAGKIVLSIYVLLFVVSVFYVVHSVDKRKTLLAFFGFLFIYNWHFNKGFMNFALSIPLFLFALGYYWRMKDDLTWKRQLMLSGLILGVYLAHLYSFGYLLCALALLAVAPYRGWRRVLQTFIPFLPTMALLCGAVAYHLPEYRQESGLVVLQYPGLDKTLRLAIGPDLPYFLSFSPDRERLILLIAAGIAFVLLLYNLKNLKQNIFLALFSLFALLYIVLPEYVSPIYHYFACRVLIFMALLGLVLLALPKRELFRWGLLVGLVTLCVAQLGVTLKNYLAVDRELRDYYAAIQHIPANKQILFQTDIEQAYVGRMSPFAFFNGYYYLNKDGSGDPVEASFTLNRQYVIVGGTVVPPLEGCCAGTLRSLQYRDSTGNISDDAGSPERIFDRDAVNVGGYAIVLSGGERNEIGAVAHRFGYEPALHVGGVVVYRRERMVLAEATQPEVAPYQEKDYLLLYQDTKHIDPAVTRQFDLVFVQGSAHVFKRRHG